MRKNEAAQTIRYAVAPISKNVDLVVAPDGVILVNFQYLDKFLADHAGETLERLEVVE